MSPPAGHDDAALPASSDTSHDGPSAPPPTTNATFHDSSSTILSTSADLPLRRPSFVGTNYFAQAQASPWVGLAQKPLTPPGLTQTDRVFPIRSVLSVDTSQTPLVAPRRSLDAEVTTSPSWFSGHSRGSMSGASDTATPSRPARKYTTGSMGREGELPGLTRASTLPLGENRRTTDSQQVDVNRMQLFSDVASSDGGSIRSGIGPSDPSVGADVPDVDSDLGLITARFKHVVTDEGHAVITGRDGELQKCEDEPIHIPGAVQGFGLLIALHEDADGRFMVRVVSENAKRIIGYSPQELFKLSSFTDILTDEQTDNLLDHVDFIRNEEADPATNGPEVFTLSIRPPHSRSIKLWCAMHTNPNSPELIICEFELDDDKECPLIPPDADTPEPPEDTLKSMPTEEELLESTLNPSRPLRVLRSARKRRGEAAAMEVFNILSQVQEQLAAAPNLELFLKVLVGVVKDLTGFHRVMIYQFDSSFNGRVVTELVDPRATKDLYKGLNFPASDIPQQARDLYKINKVRLLYDRDQITARLVCRTVEDLQQPLDLTYSYLRAMSPIHVKYLGNMGVRASMSISITAFNELWGLISCHSYGARGMRVSFPIRKMCRLIGDTASRNIERLSYASRLQARKLLNTVPTKSNPAGYIIASSDDLLSLFDADCGLLSIKGETKILGKIEQSQEALVMLEYLRMRKFNSVLTTQDIHTDFPDLQYAPGFTVLAGFLLVPLSSGGSDFIVFFRRSQVREVRWAGNPYEKTIREGTSAYLEPRKSFKVWMETVVGKCRDWTEEQVETAAVLCLVYGKFIEVWRQKEAALQNSQLTRLLLANSAHEVRTPLNAIINYLEIALEGTLDKETRENLAKSHSASKSLIYVINDLLDLTKTAGGLTMVQDEAFDLQMMIHDATAIFQNDATRKNLEYTVTTHSNTPKRVVGDERHIRQAISNLTANAIKNTTQGFVRVDLWCVKRSERRVTVDIAVQDSGSGMPPEKVDALFRELEQVGTESDELTPHEKAIVTNSSEGRTLGLGLAVVARIVRTMNGQMRLKSTEGKGSRFVIQLPFEIPVEEPHEKHVEAPPSSTAEDGTAPPAAEGEVMLLNRTTTFEGPMRKRSIEDSRSWHSHMSNSSGRSAKSTKSDVDRLIDAISEPLSVGTPESDDLRLARSNSASFKANTSFTSPMKPSQSLAKSRVPDADPEQPAGSEFIQDSKTRLTAVKIPEEEPSSPVLLTGPKVLFAPTDGKLSKKKSHARIKPTPGAPGVPTLRMFKVLLAEDDPINSRIMLKRLTKVGHVVHHTVNGQECATAFRENPGAFDVVLMDMQVGDHHGGHANMQMPIVDGLTSTKMIRSHEHAIKRSQLSSTASINGRIAIFAVSASLVERDKQVYADAGFDGWILKPIDFKRLSILMSGAFDDSSRNANTYTPGDWEHGGWFHSTTSRPPTACYDGDSIQPPASTTLSG